MQKINLKQLFLAAFIGLFSVSGLASEDKKKVLQDEVNTIIENSSKVEDEIQRKSISVETYIKHSERLEALEMQLNELKKRKAILQEKISLIELVEEGNAKEMPVVKSSNEIRLQQELESLKQKVKESVVEEDKKRDPIDMVFVKDVYLKNGFIEAKIQTLTDIQQVSVGKYLYSWKVVKVDESGIVVEKNGYRRNIGIKAGK